MKIPFVVMTAHPQGLSRIAQIDGQDYEVTIDGFVADISSLDGTAHYTIRVDPKGVEEARNLFQVGAGIFMELTPDSTRLAPPPIEVPPDPLLEATPELQAAHQRALEEAIAQHGRVDFHTLEPLPLTDQQIADQQVAAEAQPEQGA